MRDERTVFVVAGTDTGVGKTVFSAALTAALGASYWKPVQAGLEGDTDADVVARLAGLSPDRVVPSAYVLKRPASPHLAAADEGVDIRQRNLGLPETAGSMVVEGAGGLMVPLSTRLLQVDLMAHWGAPVILVARTVLGTINHSLLSLEAMRRRRVPVQGIAFVGEPAPEVERTIVSLGHVRRLGCLPRLNSITPETLAQAFGENFDIRDFEP